jgi:serine/threonine-protein kinase
MGVVHLAWDPLLRRQVALKRLLNADPVMALRFMREAQIQARVEHPRICKVFEVGSEGEHPFIAMQYIQGQTLGEAKDDLGINEKACIMANVAGALHAAHQMGLIHRDIKPSNILLEFCEDGTCVPYILDFGLARDQSVADLTLSWGLVGTPAFMSPEQAEGCEATQSSDIYSLGATFYALFGGHPPFEATTLAGLIHQQDTQIIRCLRRTIPGFPQDLDTILLKCMEADPARRYDSAFDLEEDLRRWLAGEPIRARAIGPLGRAWRRIKRHRTLSLAITAGALVALSLAGWNVHAARRARAQVELAQTFGLQVREVEQLLRIERMLPAHDIRPAEVQVKRRMSDIRTTMAKLGLVAEGPGHYALGRGHLALREFSLALDELAKARRAGFDSPDVAYATGSALMEGYFDELLHRNPQPSEHEAIRQRFAVPAHAEFIRAMGRSQEDPAFGEAQVAMLELDYPLCIRKCKDAFKARPWMYEAKVLEAQAWGLLANQSLGLGAETIRSVGEGRAALKNGESALEDALRLAPSDERICGVMLAQIVRESTFDADGGEPSEAIFKRGDALCARAMLIRPDDLRVRQDWAYGRVRQGFVQLRTGVDVRPLMRETLKALQADERKIKDEGLADVIAYLHWILADGQFRRGEDPLHELELMAFFLKPGTFDHVQPACLLAEFLASRGRSPLPVLEDAERILETGPQAKSNNYYPLTVWGNLLLVRAEWEMDEGRDPRATLDRAVLHLEQSQRLSPNSVFPPMHLVLAHAWKARRALALGQDPAPHLEAALTSGRRGLAITRSHYRLHLGLAEAHRIRALAAFAKRRDPSPFLQEARAALREGSQLNATDFRLFREAVAIEVLAADYALRLNRSPLEDLTQAERMARRGLAIKGDDPKLRLALARIDRMRAAWANSQGLSPDGAIQEARLHLAQSIGIHPSPFTEAERILIEGLASEAPVKALEIFRVYTRNHPYLALDYPIP